MTKTWHARQLDKFEKKNSSSAVLNWFPQCSCASAKREQTDAILKVLRDEEWNHFVSGLQRQRGGGVHVWYPRWPRRIREAPQRKWPSMAGAVHFLLSSTERKKKKRHVTDRTMRRKHGELWRCLFQKKIRRSPVETPRFYWFDSKRKKRAIKKKPCPSAGRRSNRSESVQ